MIGVSKNGIRRFCNGYCLYACLVCHAQAFSFLKEHDLLDEEHDADPCHKCGAIMQDKRKRNRRGEFRPVLRCPRRGCQTSRSVHQGNRFFHYTDLNGKTNSCLSLCEILELVYLFIMDIPCNTTVTLTGKSPNTVTDWYNMCREVCGEIVSHRTRGQMIGTEEKPIQIDESRFAGRRKYNRGRLLTGDHAPETKDSDADIVNNRNHGARIDGPWVFGLKNGLDVCYFYVMRRERATLIPIIERECQVGSVIHSDEWPAYLILNNIGYHHKTVNHQENYVNPISGAHTQGIERSWLDAKIDILKKKRGVPVHLFQSHLDYYC
ncbi:uncharacterized protein LOC143019764 [Oratosquilla oratoria]|uniref:uncharacterized protein LOC143019764 n=1 Tax=Oratosquilla oratoria TaxID=337810 RepID=UPI003F765BCE